MSKRTVYHVTGNRGDWRVKAEGNAKASGTYETKTEAIADAIRFAKQAPLGQVKIHREGDNVIQTEYTYGEDPRRTRG